VLYLVQCCTDHVWDWTFSCSKQELIGLWFLVMPHNYQPVKGKGMDSADSLLGKFFCTMDIMTIRFVFLAIPMFWEMRSKGVCCRYPLELCRSTKLLWSARSSEQQMKADTTFMKFLVRIDMSYECYPQRLNCYVPFLLGQQDLVLLFHTITLVSSLRF
jgi:hypothetical protein